MRKEVIVAILIGTTIGLTIAFGIWRANNALKTKDPLALNNNPSSSAKVQSTTSPTPLNSELSILSPLNEEVVVGDSTTIKGLTKQNSSVLIQTRGSDYFSKAGLDGSFEITTPLKEGLNEFQITSFDEQNKSYERQLTVISTPGKPNDDKILSSTATGSATTNDPIRQKVQEKIDNANNKLIAYFGPVTDKTESGVQMKTSKGEIKQASFSSQTSFTSLGKTTKTLIFSDLAIGDYIVAIGSKTATGSLDGSVVYITQAPNFSDFKALGGIVSVTGKKDLTIRSLDSKDLIIKPITGYKVWEISGKTLKASTYNNIEVGAKLFSAGKMVDGTLEATSLFFVGVATPAPTSKPSPSPKL